MKAILSREEAVKKLEMMASGTTLLPDMQEACRMGSQALKEVESIQEFADYLIEWIVSKNDIEFDRQTEFQTVRVIVDCVQSYGRMIEDEQNKKSTDSKDNR